MSEEQYYAEGEDWLAKRPVCAECGDHITDETAFHIHGRWFCRSCMRDFEEDIEE